jgi:predicted RNA-binding Zn ribbon-like protein
MAYPGAFQPAGSDPRTENLPQISENCTGFPALTSHCRRETVLHFDIDPLNSGYPHSCDMNMADSAAVLVGGFDEHEHNVVPILKVGEANECFTSWSGWANSVSDRRSRASESL